MKRKTLMERLLQVVCLAILATLMADPAFAQITSQASTILNDLSTGLTALGVVICTIALMWAGFKMMFQHARFGDIANIFIGAMLVGGASTIAGVLL
jgi:type IV secretion system protein VirB2